MIDVKICFLFICMLFCHIIDDYYLQGVLASMKQKRWWMKNAPEPMYKYDYIVALIMHSISWSFMITIPILLDQDFNLSWLYIIMFFANVIVHSTVDNIKANKRSLNLVEDQIIHVIQIICTILVFKL